MAWGKKIFSGMLPIQCLFIMFFKVHFFKEYPEYWASIIAGSHSLMDVSATDMLETVGSAVSLYSINMFIYTLIDWSNNPGIGSFWINIKT